MTTSTNYLTDLPEWNVSRHLQYILNHYICAPIANIIPEHVEMDLGLSLLHILPYLYFCFNATGQCVMGAIISNRQDNL